MAENAIVFLHGSGSDGHDIRTFLHNAPLREYSYHTFSEVLAMRGFELVTPTADRRPYTPCLGERMNVWFDRSADFLEKGLEDVEDEEGVTRSLDKIAALIESLAIRHKNVFVGGFSMGGGLCLNLLTRALPPAVKGIFSLGSFLVEHSRAFEKDLKSAQLPVFMMHGDRDSLIPVSWGRATASNLLLKQVEVQFREYEGVDHEMAIEELSDLFHWMEDILLRGEPSLTLIPEKSSTSITAGSQLLQSQSEDQISSAITLPCKVERQHDGTVKICYSIPVDLVEVAAARPVLACGGSFDVSPLEDGSGVFVVAVTNDAENLASEIGKRLLRRIADGSEQVNPCPIS